MYAAFRFGQNSFSRPQFPQKTQTHRAAEQWEGAGNAACRPPELCAGRGRRCGAARGGRYPPSVTRRPRPHHRGPNGGRGAAARPGAGRHGLLRPHLPHVPPRPAVVGAGPARCSARPGLRMERGGGAAGSAGPWGWQELSCRGECRSAPLNSSRGS